MVLEVNNTLVSVLKRLFSEPNQIASFVTFIPWGYFSFLKASSSISASAIILDYCVAGISKVNHLVHYKVVYFVYQEIKIP